MRVLIACECSGVVRRAFDALGHDVWSVDKKPAEDRSNRHITGDVRDYLNDGWDLMAVMHPPCTRLCNSGVRWLDRPPKNPPADCTDEEAAIWPHLSEKEQLEMIWQHLRAGADLFSDCWNAPIERIAVENPVMHRHAKALIRNFEPQAQSVQPWHFGTDEDGPDNERKRTCLWLKGLPQLQRTGTLDGTTARSSVHHASPGENRATERSRFFPGMAAAMAAQWGGYALDQSQLAA
ncbi:hypothetical protein DL1_08600 [Thioclava dalianensis]|uniref:DNA cytosine methyltransferase n=1 Tax=Thioclava dalianensis TaxID=1185766 RepID=A0A074TF82_9RHOB|nr:hypothetical protein DL1_08600 [Thioclava dalianensis]